MKTHLKNLRIPAGNVILTALFCFMAAATLQAQDLINHLGYTPPLGEKQQHYLRTITENPINENIRFVEINMEALKEEGLIFNPNPAEKYEVAKVDRGNDSPSHISWCGQIVGYEHGGGDVNMVRSGEQLSGHITVDDMIYAITYIGGGLHVFYEVNTAKLPAEDCYNVDHQHETKGPEEKRPVITDPDYVNNLSEQKISGDCKIRVLVGFTAAAEAQYFDILTEIHNLFNLANTAYNYGNVTFNIELALAYRVNYNAGSDLGDILDDWEGTSDGNMDEVHTLRSVWRADQCALIVPGGGGIANLDLDYDKQFSITGEDNFYAFTFHHELGHNMLCTHDLINTDQPGSAPYAGWGDPDGCFRTIMAYPAACGTGSCTRQNVFSRSIGTWFCGGANRDIGTLNNRNADRLLLSRNTVINHEVAPVDAFFTDSYGYGVNEAVHMAANSSFSYFGFPSNLFVMLNGSEGSFRAPNYVSLGVGFRAAEGSRFDAYIDNCDDPLGSPFDEKSGEDLGQAGLFDNSLSREDQNTFAELNVFPNPFSQLVTIEFETHDYGRVSIGMHNMMGQKVIQVLDNSNLAPGMHRLEINTADLPSGVYSIAVDADGNRCVKKVVKNR